MSLPGHIAQHFREVWFGGNWTSVNFKDALADVTWQQATTQLHSMNTIAALVFHTNYYVGAVLKVLQGEPLTAKDQYSFEHPLISCQEAWERLLTKTWTDAESFADLVEQLPESTLWDDFSDKKYGNYYRNLHGIIEHSHYHLGQIVILKKLLLRADKTDNT